MSLHITRLRLRTCVCDFAATISVTVTVAQIGDSFVLFFAGKSASFCSDKTASCFHTTKLIFACERNDLKFLHVTFATTNSLQESQPLNDQRFCGSES